MRFDCVQHITRVIGEFPLLQQDPKKVSLHARLDKREHGRRPGGEFDLCLSRGTCLDWPASGDIHGLFYRSDTRIGQDGQTIPRRYWNRQPVQIRRGGPPWVGTAINANGGP